MICPSCDSFESRVVDSRQDIERNIIRRRRKCKACGERWTTIEVEEVMYIEPTIPSKNPIIQNVQNMLIQQTGKDLKKYTANNSVDDFPFDHWVEYLQKELIEALIFAEALKQKRIQ